MTFVVHFCQDTVRCATQLAVLVCVTVISYYKIGIGLSNVFMIIYLDISSLCIESLCVFAVECMILTSVTQLECIYAKASLRPKNKSLSFLVIGRLQNRCGDTFFSSLYFWYFFSQQGTRWPNFPLYKVWWLREASQIGQTFITQCEKVV